MSQLAQCPNGFRYDQAIHSRCPCPSCWADRSSTKLWSSDKRRNEEQPIQKREVAVLRGSIRLNAVEGKRTAWRRVVINAIILLLALAVSFLTGLYLVRTFSPDIPKGVGIATAIIFMALLVIWAVIGRLLLRATRMPRLSKLQRMLVVFVAIGIWIILRAVVVQPFNINGESMEPALFGGDYVLVLKYTYGLTHYSFPFSPPIFRGRIFAFLQPDRGDSVVFRLPSDDKEDRIGRIVGLSGDRIQMIGGLLHINGQPVRRDRIDDFVETEAGGRTIRVKRWRETLPNGVSYSTLELIENGFYDNTPVYEVPPGHYFMMGDNRENSNDSRVLSEVGYVPLENLVGPIRAILWPNTMKLSIWRSPFL